MITTKSGTFQSSQWKSKSPFDVVIKTTMTTGPIEGDEIKMDETEDSSVATLVTPPSNDDEKLKTKTAVDNYVTNLAKVLKRSKDDLKELVPKLLDILQDNEFWSMDNDAQKEMK